MHCVSVADFIRAVTSTKAKVTPKQAKVLAQAYLDNQHGKTRMVQYRKFCRDMETTFGMVEGLEQNPTMQPPVTVHCNEHFNTRNELTGELYDELNSTIAAFRKKVKNEGITPKSFFIASVERQAKRADVTITHSFLPPSQDFDRRGVGYVTRSQFERGVKIMWPGAADALEPLMAAYGDADGKVNYRQFSNDVSQEPADNNSFSTASMQKRVVAIEGKAEDKFADYLGLADLEETMRDLVAEQSIDLKTFFCDYDKLHTGKVPIPKFINIVKAIFQKQYINADVLGALAQKYVCSYNSGMCDYKRFIKAIDVDRTNTEELHTSPLKAIPPLRREVIAQNTLQLRTDNFTGMESALIKRILKFIKNRRILLKPKFMDFDKFKMGYVSVGQFHRVLNVELKDLNLLPEEVSTLVRMFPKRKGGATKVEFVDYYLFINTVDPSHMGENTISSSMAPAFGSYDAMLESKFAAGPRVKGVLAKVQKQVLERSIRLKDFLEASDKSRAGKIPECKFCSGLDQANIKLVLTPAELQVLQDEYKVGERIISWRAFMRDVSAVETVVGLELNPTLSGNPESLPAEFVRSVRAEEEMDEDLRDLLDKIRTEVKTKRMLLLPNFKTFDSLNRGKLSRANFERALEGTGLDCLKHRNKIQAIQAIIDEFVDRSSQMVNYRSFLELVDPSDEKNERRLGVPLGSVSLSECKHEEKEGGIEDTEELLRRVTDTLIRNQMRVREALTDYNLLRKGTVPRSKFVGCLRTNFKLEGLRPHELEQIADYFAVDKDNIAIEKFIHLVDGGNEALEKNPTRIFQGKVATSRGRALLSSVDEEKLHVVLHPMRAEINKRHINISPQFKLYDKNNLRAVTMPQFLRVLRNNNLNFNVLPGGVDPVKVLRAAYPSKHPEKIDWVTFVNHLES